MQTLDSNQDSVFNTQDDIYSELQAWQDTNQNGETDTGEIKSLAEAGIAELSLNDNADGAFTSGNEIKSNSTYRRNDGSTYTLARNRKKIFAE